MDRRLAGVLALAFAVAAVIFVPQVLSPGLAGRPVAAPLPEPPAIGSCVQRTRPILVLVDCSLPHRGEVTARWLADDPRRPTDATVSTCADASVEYLDDLLDVQQSGWTLTVLRTESRLVHAPDTERAGENGWNACIVRAPQRQLYLGSLRELPDVTGRPAVFGNCTSMVGGAVGCLEPHELEELGVLRGQSASDNPGEDRWARAERISSTLHASCVELAIGLTGASDPTYAGQLAVEVLVDELSFGAVAIDPPRLLTVYHATCGLRYAGAGAQLPTSSVVGLGATELPLG